jgi:hypothetical protein
VVMEGLGASLSFKMPLTKRLRKMLKVWSERVGVPMDRQAFEYDAQPVGVDDTPESLGMVPGETAIIRASQL